MNTQTIDGTRFGTLSYEDQDAIHFPSGLIGFEDLHDFVLVNHKEGSPFRWMQSVQEPSIALLLVPPTHYLDEYAPTIADDDLQELGFGEGDALLTYATVTIPKGQPEAIRLNLAAPILIHPVTRLAVQAVTDDPAYTIQYHVFGSAGNRKPAAA